MSAALWMRFERRCGGGGGAPWWGGWGGTGGRVFRGLRVRGAYSVVVLTQNEVLAFRDPNGVRPLCLGKLNGHGWIVASETCALNPLGASFVREIEPGELVVLDREGCTPTKGAPADRPSMCVFEFIYFARPDSYIYGESMHVVRQRMGQELAAE